MRKRDELLQLRRAFGRTERQIFYSTTQQCPPGTTFAPPPPPSPSPPWPPYPPIMPQNATSPGTCPTYSYAGRSQKNTYGQYGYITDIYTQKCILYVADGRTLMAGFGTGFAGSKCVGSTYLVLYSPSGTEVANARNYAYCAEFSYTVRGACTSQSACIADAPSAPACRCPPVKAAILTELF